MKVKINSHILHASHFQDGYANCNDTIRLIGYNIYRYCCPNHL